jgi:hypothetical protein
MKRSIIGVQSFCPVVTGSKPIQSSFILNYRDVSEHSTLEKSTSDETVSGHNSSHPKPSAKTNGGNQCA